MILLFFCLGAIVGSFLNVIILRYGARRPVGRSHCFSCSTPLRWYELIPVASFVFLGGRCSSCGARISLQYPLVELLTGIVFALVFLKESSLLSVPFVLLLWSLLIVIAVYDLRHKIIPDGAVYTALTIALILFGLRLVGNGLYHNWWLDAAGGLLLPLPFAALWFFSQGRAMGLGDAKLLALFSWFLGFSYGLSALILGFWFGATIALLLLLLRSVLKSRLGRLTMKTELPLAPFLIAGLFVVYMTGLDVTGLSLLLA